MVNKEEIEYTNFCRLTAYVKPKTKKTIIELSKKLGVSRSEIVCNIIEKHLVTMEAVK